MGVFGWWQWLIVLVIVLLLFGRGKIPELMGDVAKGIKNFRSGLSDDSDAKEDGTKTVEHKSEEAVDTAAAAKKKS
ncbi:MAG: twin-arginine translocase TatA/TatE family subunit [Ahrensia sp.]|nr:twin-arginine translocase TatA/TatE family subunit [Ahrensia sp.]